VEWEGGNLFLWYYHRDYTIYTVLFVLRSFIYFVDHLLCSYYVIEKEIGRAVESNDDTIVAGSDMQL